MRTDLARVVDEYHRALDAFVTGKSEPLRALYSHLDDVTIANPFGPTQRGQAALKATLERAAAHYRDGRSIEFELVSQCVTAELAYTVEVERYEAKVAGSDESTPVSVRVTTVFRREQGSWNVVHRHADPITAPRPPESVVQPS